VRVVERRLVLVEHAVHGGDVAALQLVEQTLHGEVARPVVQLVVAEHQHGVVPPAEVLADAQREAPQLLVGGAGVGDGRVDGAVEGDGRRARRDHGHVPVRGEEAHGRRGVGAAGPDEGPRVVGQLQVHRHERRDGLGADAGLVLAVLEDVDEVAAGQQGGVGVDDIHGAPQGGADAWPRPRVLRVAAREDDGQRDVRERPLGLAPRGDPAAAVGEGPVRRRGTRVQQDQQDQQDQQESCAPPPEGHPPAQHFHRRLNNLHPVSCRDTHTHTHTYTRAHTHIHTHTQAHTHTHISTHTHARTHTYISTRAHTYTRAHTHIHKHTRTHTRTHTHTHSYNNNSHKPRSRS